MSEYRVLWWKTPYKNTRPQVLFVDAASEDHARVMALDYIERTEGTTGFAITEVKVYVQPKLGKVLP